MAGIGGAATHDAARQDTRTRRKWYWAWAVALPLSGCGGAEIGALPPDVVDPKTIQNEQGALAYYRYVNGLLPNLFDRFAGETGVVTDELAALPMPVFRGGAYTELDGRTGLASIGKFYFDNLNLLRAQARESRGFLTSYPFDGSVALRGHLYALEGYAEIFLADLFCSGIPLSTVDYRGDYTLAAGSTTKEVYEHAAELFDSAVTLLADSLRLQRFAAIGRGRALLGAGRLADAAAAVADVPSDYSYQVVATDDPRTSFIEERPILRTIAEAYDQDDLGLRYRPGTPSVGDREGGVGADFRSVDDPRINPVVLGQDANGNDLYFSGKYATDGSTPLSVAEGAEARLIEAEDALQAGRAEWLVKLNDMRRTVGLEDTTDPGTAAGRLHLLFRERAFWLYLTGHRQGDLRRLARIRPMSEVYPLGASYAGGSGSYGSDVVVPVPTSERELNPKYAGCFNLNP